MLRPQGFTGKCLVCGRARGLALGCLCRGARVQNFSQVASWVPKVRKAAQACCSQK